MEELLANFGEEINEVVHDFLPRFMFGGGQAGLTQYIFWMCVAIILMLVVLFAVRGRLSLVPRGRFVNGV